MIPRYRAYDSGSLCRMYSPSEVMVGDSCIWILDEDSESNEWIVNNDLGKHLRKSRAARGEIMSVRYKYSGLTPELHQRLVSEHEALKQAHKKGSYKQYFQEVRQCSEAQARIIYQAFNSAVVERARISPATVDRLEGIISDELFDDLQDYLSTNYTRGKTTRPVLDKANAGLPEHLFKRFQEEVEELRKEHPNNLNNYIREVKGYDQKNANRTQNALNLCYAEKAALTPLKAVQMEGMLSRELFSEIIDFVFNNYEWSERLDSEVDRIILKYRTKGKIGRDKATVRKALYTAYALGV